jgi:diaminopimelate decarboxylase
MTKLDKTDIKILLQFTQPTVTGRQGIQFTSENIDEIINQLALYPQIELFGIASHRGTQLNTEKEYLENITFLKEIASQIESKSEIKVKSFNIGGGFPNADSLHNDQLTKILTQVNSNLNENAPNNYSIFYEPGRYIVGDTGFCIAKVLKYNKDSKTVFLDIGTQFIPKFMKSSLRFYNLDNLAESPNTSVDLMGPLPSDEDILIKNYFFPPTIHPGDRILIANVGAYALTFSTRFPYPIPSIMTIKGKDYKYIRTPQSSSDFSLL